ncbi:signal peptide peptidase SppA [Candidatus Cyanaurora vandensis]|uniref:signal peptide peptidase SppA n=1 Tax=Candidatus Cyanaurora vandensis TaxID=2714958 RepID=UPI00257E2A29|nr:signal peptide peptidase SppA [Candidatus Cyanaurora vandensis]
MMQNLNRYLALALILLCVAATVVGLGKTKSPEAATVRNGEMVLPVGDRLELLTLEGTITSGRTGGGIFSSGEDALSVRDRLLEIVADDQIKGVLLRIDSPGGTVGTSQEVYNALGQVRAQKPVVVSMGDVAASGGYYIACGADRIFANPGTLTGSIGVILSGYNAAKLLGTLGVEPQVVKSGPYKDILSINRALTPSERTLLQALIGDTYEQFLQAVAKGRNLPLNALRPLADGRIYTGRQAQRLGLVDELGGLTEAKAHLRRLAKERFSLDQELPLVEGGGTLDGLFRRLIPAAQTKTPLGLDLNNTRQPLWLAPGLTP